MAQRQASGVLPAALRPTRRRLAALLAAAVVLWLLLALRQAQLGGAAAGRTRVHGGSGCEDRL